MYSIAVVHIYICLVITELLCHPSRVSKVFSAAGEPRYIPLRDNRDPINQEHVFFFVFHFELTFFLWWPALISSARPTVFNWKLYEGLAVQAREKVNRVRSSASGTGLKKALLYMCLLKKRWINSTVSIGPLTRNQALRTLAWKLKKIGDHLAYALAIYRKSLCRTGDALTFRKQVYLRISCGFLRSCHFITRIVLIVLAARQCGAWPSTLITHKHSRHEKTTDIYLYIFYNKIMNHICPIMKIFALMTQNPHILCVHLIKVKTTTTTTSSIIKPAHHYMNIQPWLVADTYQVRT